MTAGNPNSIVWYELAKGTQVFVPVDPAVTGRGTVCGAMHGLGGPSVAAVHGPDGGPLLGGPSVA